MLATPVLAAIILAITASVAFGSGWAVNGWRMDGKMHKLDTANTVLVAANDRCAADIQLVRAAMHDMTAAVAQREKNAADAQREAQPEAEIHTRRAKTIRAMAPVPLDMQCEAIKEEQLLYVQSRTP